MDPCLLKKSGGDPAVPAEEGNAFASGDVSGIDEEGSGVPTGDISGVAGGDVKTRDKRRTNVAT